MKIPPVSEGYERQWVKCKECEKPFYYDYIPYSLGNPIKWLPCGHNVGSKFRDAVVNITADEAIILLTKS